MSYKANVFKVENKFETSNAPTSYSVIKEHMKKSKVTNTDLHNELYSNSNYINTINKRKVNKTNKKSSHKKSNSTDLNTDKINRKRSTEITNIMNERIIREEAFQEK